jgi:hypothetical protein
MLTMLYNKFQVGKPDIVSANQNFYSNLANRKVLSKMVLSSI